MDRKTKIETMLNSVNNGIYHVNDISIFANNFEIVNDELIKFYMNVSAYQMKHKFIVALIPLKEVISIDGINVKAVRIK